MRISSEMERKQAVEKAREEVKVNLHRAEAEYGRLKGQYLVEQARRKTAHNKLVELMGNIRVICRVRPINQTELKTGLGQDCTSYPMEAPDENIKDTNLNTGIKRVAQELRVMEEERDQLEVKREQVLHEKSASALELGQGADSGSAKFQFLRFTVQKTRDPNAKACMLQRLSFYEEDKDPHKHRGSNVIGGEGGGSACDAPSGAGLRGRVFVVGAGEAVASAVAKTDDVWPRWCGRPAISC